MTFKRYQHLEKYGSVEVEGIDIGTCYIFPKIDGTNASVWFENGKINAGSRKKHLTEFGTKDNAGFFEWASQNEKLQKFFNKYPHVRLFGEWLVPHSLKTYRDDAWRKFYIFDVTIDLPGEFKTNTLGEEIRVNPEYGYLKYEEYKGLLDEFELDYIPPIKIIKNPSYEKLLNTMKYDNTFLIEDGKGYGEGIVIKNYNYRNKYGRITWAKMVTNEFKEKHKKEMGANKYDEKKLVEEKFIDEKCTKALVEKVHAKIVNEVGEWTNKMIPRLLQTVYHDLVTEEIWDFVKTNKNPTINFKTLQVLTNRKIKEVMSELF